MLVRPSDQARKEIRDMVDATLSVIVREHDVDESFVITEIKDYLNSSGLISQNKKCLKVIQYSQGQVLRRGGLGSIVQSIRSKVQRIGPFC